MGCLYPIRAPRPDRGWSMLTSFSASVQPGSCLLTRPNDIGATMATPVPEHSTPPRRDGFYLPRWLLVSLGAVVVLAIGFGLGRLVDRNDGRRRLDGFRDHADGHPALRILIVLIVIALIVTAIVMLVRHFSAKEHDRRATERTPSSRPPSRPSPIGSHTVRSTKRSSSAAATRCGADRHARPVNSGGGSPPNGRSRGRAGSPEDAAVAGTRAGRARAPRAAMSTRASSPVST